MSTISISKIRYKDIQEVAKIHYQYLKIGILSHLGEKFLSTFYKVLIKNDNTFTVVATADAKVVGFATGAINLKTIPNALITDLWWPTVLALAKRPALIFKVVQMKSYPSFNSTDNVGEIFSLAVIPRYRKMGIGTKLITSCKNEFTKRGCKHFQLSVRKKMHEANSFYEKLNLEKKATGKFLNEEIIFYGN